ncbi:MAG: helix-turn-helix transcriptional regulator [Ramlibacter sp.]
MSHLTRNDYSTALALLARLEQLAGEPQDFVRASLDALAGFVASERADVGVCDLAGDADVAPRDAPTTAGRYLAAIPLAIQGRKLLRIELRRGRCDFSQRDRERLALLQPHLAYLYRQACAPGPIATARPAGTPPPAAWPAAADGPLTPREGDVMKWVACGKTDADIAVLLAISPRTVHKHLEHIYEKLGVETRTAAVMAMQRTARPNAGVPPLSAGP